MRMRTWFIVGVGLSASAMATIASAQGPAPRDDLVVRMMAFDKDQNGTLTKAEVTDERLHRLFDRADADKDGTLTREELETVVSKEPPFMRGGPPGGGPPGFMGGFPPRPGEILPPPLQQRLRLTDDQKRQLADLQREVDASLAKILNDDQKAELKAMRERGPGGFGGPGGPGGPSRGNRPGGNRPR